MGWKFLVCMFYLPLLIQNRLLNPKDRIMSLSDFEVTLGGVKHWFPIEEEGILNFSET